MATPSKTPQTGFNVVPVTISVDTITHTIQVDTDPFVVSKSKKDQVQWICGQNHEHNPKGCFWVHFDPDSPFDKKEFRIHKELSGAANEPSVIDKKYKYTVEIDGCPPLDPIGIVKP